MNQQKQDCGRLQPFTVEKTLLTSIIKYNLCVHVCISI